MEDLGAVQAKLESERNRHKSTSDSMAALLDASEAGKKKAEAEALDLVSEVQAAHAETKRLERSLRASEGVALELRSIGEAQSGNLTILTETVDRLKRQIQGLESETVTLESLAINRARELREVEATVANERALRASSEASALGVASSTMASEIEILREGLAESQRSSEGYGEIRDFVEAHVYPGARTGESTAETVIRLVRSQISGPASGDFVPVKLAVKLADLGGYIREEITFQDGAPEGDDIDLARFVIGRLKVMVQGLPGDESGQDLEKRNRDLEATLSEERQSGSRHRGFLARLAGVLGRFTATGVVTDSNGLHELLASAWALSGVVPGCCYRSEVSGRNCLGEFEHEGSHFNGEHSWEGRNLHSAALAEVARLKSEVEGQDLDLEDLKSFLVDRNPRIAVGDEVRACEWAKATIKDLDARTSRHRMQANGLDRLLNVVQPYSPKGVKVLRGGAADFAVAVIRKLAAAAGNGLAEEVVGEFRSELCDLASLFVEGCNSESNWAPGTLLRLLECAAKGPMRTGS